VRTGRTILLGVIAIGTVAVLGLAFVVWVTGELPGGAPRAASTAESRDPPAAASPAAAEAPEASGLSPIPGPLPEPPVAPATTGEEWAPSAPRRLPRGSPPPMDLLSALAGVRAEIKRCPGSKKLARPAPAPQAGSAPRPGRAAPGGALTVLLLQLEPQDGAVLVAEAPVQSKGLASPELLDCATKLLVGQTFPASAAQPGPRIPMQLVLEP